MEVGGASATIITAVVRNLISAITLGVTPLDEAIDFVNTANQTAFAFVLTNLSDPDALNLASQQIYCAIQRSYPNLDNIWDEIEWAAGLPEFSGTLGVSWDSFGSVIDWINSASTGELAGWLILQYMQFGWESSNSESGIIEGSAAELLAYANAAEFFDDRDCSTYDCPEPYDWEHVFDFTTGSHGWSTFPESATVTGGGSYSSGVGFVSALSSGSHRIRANISIPTCQIEQGEHDVFFESFTESD